MATEIPALASVPSHSLDQAIAFLRAGGRLVVPSYTRTVLLTGKTLAKFEAAPAGSSGLRKAKGNASGAAERA